MSPASAGARLLAVAEKMSRRKQANPKPLKIDEEGASQSETAESPHRVFPPVRPEANSRQNYADQYDEDDIDDDDDDDLRPLVIDTSESPKKSTSQPPPNEDSMEPLVLETNNDAMSEASDISSQFNESSSHSLDSSTVGRSNEEGLASFIFADRGPDGKIRQPTPSKTRRKSDKILPVAGEDGAEKFVCPICQSLLPDNHELTNHIRSHNTTTLATANTCTICGKVLSSQSSLDRHMLVHSGERPFMCRICKMSFTTNGNMHRHMRIHEKELNAPAGSLMVDEFVKQPARQRKRVDVEASLKRVHQQAMEGGVKRKLAMAMDDASPMKRQQFAMPNRYDIMPKALAFPETTHPHLPAAKHDVHVATAPSTSTTTTAAAPAQLSLESHLESQNQDHAAHCSKCNVTFRSAKGLHIHSLLVHMKNKSKDSSYPELDSLQVKQVLSAPTMPVGFQDLSFVDFTCENFPLVAKSWCEKNPRRSGSDLHNFSCRQCMRSFPCGSALQLHLETHPPECMAVCVECDVNFIDTQKFEDHMIQHSQDKILSSYATSRGVDDNDVQDMVAKEDFLLVCGLKTSDEQPKQLDLNKRKQVDLKMNNSYYVRLGEVKPYRAENDSVNSNKSVVPLVVPTPPSSRLLSPPHGPVPPLMRPVAARPQQPQQGIRMTLAQMMERPRVKQEPGCSEEGEILAMNGKDESPDKSERESGPFRCDYCEEIFTNYRSYKGHVRAHLGLSPYKCNLCNYSSADKSTLIRHLRTHNGERPFQCLVCDFAFTTKANCERHVRKKHIHISREEIDRTIGYNQYVRDQSAIDEECFASPDTVCKYCGEDFKFFRALKHHLRSHSSCRFKPFMCKLCTNGFSTKANCMRHIQKQHMDIEQNQIEQQIHVNELYLDSDGETIPQQGSSWWEDESHQRGATPVRGSPVTPRLAAVHPRPLTYITTPPMPSLIKPEPMERQEEQPLDFSLKGHKTSQVAPPPQPRAFLQVRPSAMQEGTDEQPIDLTVKKPGAAVPPLQRIPPPPPPPPPMGFAGRSANIVAPVPHMLMPFRHPAAAAAAGKPSSLQTKHPNLLVHIRGHAKDQLHRCEYCPAVFTLHLDLENHLRVTHKVTVPIETLGLRARAPPAGERMRMPPALLKVSRPGDQHPSEPDNNNNDSKPCDSHCHRSTPRTTTEGDTELSSIRRMLDAANTALPTTDGFMKLPQPRSTVNPPKGVHDERSLSPAPSGSRDDQPSTPVKVSDNESDDENGDDSMDGDQPKKKRNSYSDSPHKLHCPYCPRAFPWISSLKRHLLTHTGHKPFKCPQCPVTFSTKSNRERHMIRKHGLNVHDPATRQMMDRPYKCHLCVFSSFASGSNLVRHYKDKHPDKDIPDSVMNVVSMGGLSEEQCSMLEKLDNMQDTMSEVSEGRSSGIMELELDEPEEEQDMDVMTLDPSEEVAQVMAAVDDGLSKRLLDRSTPCSTPETVISDKHVNPERDNYNVDKITDCWKCGAGYDTRKALLRHLKEHNIDFPFKCYLCDASFEERRECLDHTVERHAGDWDVLCEKNKVHDMDYFIKCMDEIVEQTLSGNLDGRTAEALTRMQLEELRPESDYAQRKVYCGLCPKRFWSLQDLRRHMRSHTGERPFECDICGKRFTLKHSMMRHRRKHVDTTNTSTMSVSDDEVNSIADENGGDTGFRAAVMNAYNGETVQSDSNRSTPNWQGENIPFKSSHDRSRSSSPLRQPPPLLRRPTPLKPSPLTNNNRQGGEAATGGPASDILQNLLGIGGNDLDQMLTSTPDDAAKMLGM